MVDGMEVKDTSESRDWMKQSEAQFSFGHQILGFGMAMIQLLFLKWSRNNCISE